MENAKNLEPDVRMENLSTSWWMGLDLVKKINWRYDLEVSVNEFMEKHLPKLQSKYNLDQKEIYRLRKTVSILASKYVQMPNLSASDKKESIKAFLDGKVFDMLNYYAINGKTKKLPNKQLQSVPKVNLITPKTVSARLRKDLKIDILFARLQRNISPRSQTKPLSEVFDVEFARLLPIETIPIPTAPAQVAEVDAEIREQYPEANKILNKTAFLKDLLISIQEYSQRQVGSESNTSEASQSEPNVHFIVMDLLGLGNINNLGNQGQESGDIIIREILTTLGLFQQEGLNITVYRFGGDEFGLKIVGARDDQHAVDIENNIRKAIKLKKLGKKFADNHEVQTIAQNDNESFLNPQKFIDKYGTRIKEFVAGFKNSLQESDKYLVAPLEQLLEQDSFVNIVQEVYNDYGITIAIGSASPKKLLEKIYNNLSVRKSIESSSHMPLAIAGDISGELSSFFYKNKSETKREVFTHVVESARSILKRLIMQCLLDERDTMDRRAGRNTIKETGGFNYIITRLKGALGGDQRTQVELRASRRLAEIDEEIEKKRNDITAYNERLNEESGNNNTNLFDLYDGTNPINIRLRDLALERTRLTELLGQRRQKNSVADDNSTQSSNDRRLEVYGVIREGLIEYNSSSSEN